MNSNQAKKIPLSGILDQLGHQPHHQHRDELLYFSPFRKETEPSFSINETRNIWFDFGEGKGGNVIDFLMEYYNLDNVVFALHQLETLMEQQRIEPVKLVTATKNTSTPLEIQKIQPLQNRALSEYLRGRGISTATAQPYVKEIYYTRKDKHYFALAFKNNSGGYELRNPYFKGVHGSKDITIIEKKELLAKRKGRGEGQAVTVFEGFMDFLSALTYYGKDITTPVIVMNSTALKERTIEAIEEMGAGKVYLYLDRDQSGRELTEHFKQQLYGVTVLDKSELYADYKDFNEFLISESQKKGNHPSLFF